MATVGNLSVDDTESRVTIEQLEIEDERLANFLAGFDADERDEAFIRALRIGASALEIVETTKDVEYVDKRFTELEREFESELKELRDELDGRFGDDGKLSGILEKHFGEDGRLVQSFEDVFGDDGQLSRRLDDELGEDGEKIQNALDPNTEGTPTNQLKKEIEKVAQRLDEESGKQAIREKTSLKGFDFERQMTHLLGELVHQTPNQVQDTSEVVGAVQHSMKGDFVVTLGDTGQRVVIEAKNGNLSGTVEDEMREAIENREADYGILVARSVEYLPETKVGWFSEIDQDFVVVALSESTQDDIEPKFLNFAYHWARTRTLLSAVEIGDEVDPKVVKTELDGVRASIERFKNIRSSCSDLEESIEDIRRTLSEIEAEVQSRLATLEQEVRSTDT